MTSTVAVANTIADVISEASTEPVWKATPRGVKELMAYFSVDRKGICSDEGSSDGKVTVPEFNVFWKSLTDEDKAYFKNVAL